MASLLVAHEGAGSFANQPAIDSLAAAGGGDLGDRVLQSGEHLGPFEVTEFLAAGGMGEVYRARDTRLGRDVAIKTLPRFFATDSERLARFQREARLLAALNHPHIAAIYGVEEVDDVLGLVLEFVDGETLRERLKRGPLPVTEVLAIAHQIADALEAAHEHGIVHRDLKPANIKVRADGRVKVLDFGLAKALGDEVTADPATSPTLTAMALRAGVLMGTAAYVSPEQARAGPVDKRTDIWAFGSVLYEMLTGQRAFEGKGITDVLVSVLERDETAHRWPHVLPDGDGIVFTSFSAQGGTSRVVALSLKTGERRRLLDGTSPRYSSYSARAQFLPRQPEDPVRGPILPRASDWSPL